MWYYLDERNQVCGPVETNDPRMRVGWDDDTRQRMREEGRAPNRFGHGIRPCGWERVAFTEVAEGVTVSTVFLGLDHGFNLSKESPTVFETLTNWGYDYMAPPPPVDVVAEPRLHRAYVVYREIWERDKDRPFPQEWDMQRYQTWAQAEAGHQAMVVKVTAAVAEQREKVAAIWNQALESVE